MTDIIVSLTFLSPVIGYSSAALLNNTIHVRLGQRGVAIIGPTCHFVAYIVISLHPPYPVLVVVFVITGFGNGLEEAAWNAFLGKKFGSCSAILHWFRPSLILFKQVKWQTLMRYWASFMDSMG